MYWTKVKESTRTFLYSAGALGLVGGALFYGANLNTTGASAKTGGTETLATFPANPASLGAIPDHALGCDGTPAAPRNVTFEVSGLSGNVSNVEVTGISINHSWVGDVQAVLIAPNGASHSLFGRTLATTATSCGDSSDLVGPYMFTDAAAAPPNGGWWQATGATTGPVPSGSYRTTNIGGAGATNPMPPTSMNAAFAGVANPNGTWTLRLGDHGGGDTGAITAVSLTVEAGGGGGTSDDANVDMNGDGRSDWVITRGTSTPLTEATAPNESLNVPVFGSLRERREYERENRGKTESILGAPIYWYVNINPTGETGVGQLGDSGTDFLTPEDFDGDSKDDLAVWTPGPAGVANFKILQSSTNTVRVEVFGQDGDDPAIVGDYDGDNKADPAVYRCPVSPAPAGQCTFYFRGSNNNPAGNVTFVPWGFGTDATIFASPGDFDGDGKYDFCIQRTSFGSQGQFVLLRSGDLGVEFISWGLNSDFIIPGDYDGDGKHDFMVRRTQNGSRFNYLLTRTGATGVIQWGLTGDVSTPGDYDADGKTDVAIWRPSADSTQNYFWVRNSSNGMLTQFEWGQQGDVPAASWNVH